MIPLSEQPTIDINKIVAKYQAIISDIQLQNILLNIRVEELQQSLSAQMAAAALGQQTVTPASTVARASKAKD
jgi:hypothetical protein